MIKLGDEISTIGAWSTIFHVVGEPDKCAKVLAPHREYKGDYPDPSLIVKEKYKIDDLLVHEYENYKRILAATPDDLKHCLVKIYSITRTECERDAMLMEMVSNQEGKVASNLTSKNVKVSEKFFFKLERLRKEVFIKHSIDYFGFACRNILVKDEDTPVIIDFQKNFKFFQKQFWLRIPFFIRLKMNRYYQRVYQELGVPDYTKFTDQDWKIDAEK